MPAFAFEKIYRVLDKARRTFKKMEAKGKHFDIILNSDEVCMRYCPSVKKYVLFKGCGRLVCNEKTDEQTKDTFSLMFTCGILRDSETNSLKGFYSLPGFMFSGRDNGHMDVLACQRMHDPQKGASTPFIGFNQSHYFDADRFNYFIDFLISQRGGKRIMWFIDSATTHFTPDIRKKLETLWVEDKLYCFFLPRNTTLVMQVLDYSENVRLKAFIAAWYENRETDIKPTREEYIAKIVEYMVKCNNDCNEMKRLIKSFTKLGQNFFDFENTTERSSIYYKDIEDKASEPIQRKCIKYVASESNASNPFLSQYTDIVINKIKELHPIMKIACRGSIFGQTSGVYTIYGSVLPYLFETAINDGRKIVPPGDIDIAFEDFEAYYPDCPRPADEKYVPHFREFLDVDRMKRIAITKIGEIELSDASINIDVNVTSYINLGFRRLLHEVDLDCNQCVAQVQFNGTSINVKIDYLPAFERFMASRISTFNLTPYTKTRSIIRCLYKALVGGWEVKLEQEWLLRRLLLGDKKSRSGKTCIYSSHKEKFDYLQQHFQEFEQHPNYQHLIILMEFEVKDSVTINISTNSSTGEKLVFSFENKKFSCIVPPLTLGQKTFPAEITKSAYDAAPALETACPIENQSDFIALEETKSVFWKHRKLYLERKIGRFCWHCDAASRRLLSKSCPRLLCKTCCNNIPSMKNRCKTHNQKKKKPKKRTANALSSTPKETCRVNAKFPRIRLWEMGKQSPQTPNTKCRNDNTSNDDTTPAPVSCTLALETTGADERNSRTDDECMPEDFEKYDEDGNPLPESWCFFDES